MMDGDRASIDDRPAVTGTALFRRGLCFSQYSAQNAMSTLHSLQMRYLCLQTNLDSDIISRTLEGIPLLPAETPHVS